MGESGVNILLLGLVTVGLYVGTVWQLANRLTMSARDKALNLASSAPFAASLVLHALVLWHAIVTDAGLNLGFFNAASLVGWVITAMVLITAMSRRADSLGLFVLPFAAVTVVCVMLFPSTQTLTADLSVGVQTHVVVSLLGYGLLALAAVQAMLVWLQDQALRKKRLTPVLRSLPPLTSQEGLLFQLMGAGFFFLSLSLASGIVFVDDLFAQHLAHKTALSGVAWLVFGILLWGRWRHGWRGHSVVRWSLIGFAALALAYFGAKLILELLLDRSWSG